jgi:hypothetical protein
MEPISPNWVDEIESEILAAFGNSFTTALVVFSKIGRRLS